MNILWSYYIIIADVSKVVQISYLDMEPKVLILRSQFATLDRGMNNKKYNSVIKCGPRLGLHFCIKGSILEPLILKLRY